MKTFNDLKSVFSGVAVVEAKRWNAKRHTATQIVISPIFDDADADLTHSVVKVRRNKETNTFTLSGFYANERDPFDTFTVSGKYFVENALIDFFPELKKKYKENVVPTVDQRLQKMCDMLDAAIAKTKK